MIRERSPLRNIVGAAGIAAALTSCQYPVTEGEVFQKTHTPQHTEEGVSLRETYHYPETWVLSLAKCPSEKIPPRKLREVYWDCEVTNHSVSQEAYDEVHVGDHYKVSQDVLRNTKPKIEFPKNLVVHRFSSITKAK
jgi:hypothetical protein